MSSIHIMIGLPSMTIQRIQRNCLPPFAPPLHICQRLRPGEMPEPETWYLQQPPTMNSPSQKIHSCSKGGPDFGLTNACYQLCHPSFSWLFSKFWPPKMVGWSWLRRVLVGLTKKKCSLQNDIVTRSPAETPRTTSQVTIRSFVLKTVRLQYLNHLTWSLNAYLYISICICILVTHGVFKALTIFYIFCWPPN